MAAADSYETELAVGHSDLRRGRFNSRSIGVAGSGSIMLLHCCFSGSFPFGVPAPGPEEQVDVQRHLLGRRRVMITASNAMEYLVRGR